MKAVSQCGSRVADNRRQAEGSVLVIVLWISLGLVSLAIYFAQTTSLALKASDQRLAGLEAERVMEGATRYISYVLANTEQRGLPPLIQNYLRDAVPVGDATFWLVGRDPQQVNPNAPYFGLVDESSKLNLNTATQEMLELLPIPGISEVAPAIVDWRDADSEVRTGGAEDETYLRLNPPYRCKNGNFETVDELRQVRGVTMEMLYGEDTNRNGVLDPNENDGDVTPPSDNRDGRLDPGLVEYLTAFSRESNLTTNGTQRVNVVGTGAARRAASVLEPKFGAARSNQILARLGNANVQSVLEFFIRSQMTTDEFAQIGPELTMSNGSSQPGLVNVNTASEAVLACIPGIGVNNAPQLVSYRLSNPDKLTSVAWVAEVLDRASAIRAGPYLTGYTFQYTADISATGRLGRGYRRWQVVLDTTETVPRVIYQRDLSYLGWALGQQVRIQQQQQLARMTR